MYHWVDSDQALKEMLSHLVGCHLLAVDTEFIRTNTFHPKIALVQISDGDQCWLVDVLAFQTFENLKELLEAPHRQLIFHACAEDLEVLEYALGIKTSTIFDTQIAAGITNIGYSMGYARLVAQMFDVELGKQETRSDWLARPLTDKQKQYAADDVFYLHKIHSLLVKELEEQNRSDWFDEETIALHEMVSSRKNTDEYYVRVKGAWKLGEKSLRVLKRLCNWREMKARQRDKPRGHVVKDGVLLELARRMPTTLANFNGINDLHPGQIKRYGLELLSEIQIAEADEMVSPLPEPLNKANASVLKVMRNCLGDMAEELSIPQEYLANKKELEAIVRSAIDSDCQWPVRFTQGWRAPYVRPALEKILESEDYQ